MKSSAGSGLPGGSDGWWRWSICSLLLHDSVPQKMHWAAVGHVLGMVWAPSSLGPSDQPKECSSDLRLSVSDPYTVYASEYLLWDMCSLVWNIPWSLGSSISFSSKETPPWPHRSQCFLQICTVVLMRVLGVEESLAPPVWYPLAS